MTTKLSSDGQIVLPRSMSQEIGLQPGDLLDVTLENGRIVIERTVTGLQTPKIHTDPTSGLPVLAVDGDMPPLTSEQVEHLLTEFP